MKVYVDIKNEGKMTKTSKFLGLLIKSCILPIRISDNKVIFRFFSAKILFHFLEIFLVAIVCASYGFIFFPQEYIKMIKKVLKHQTSWIEELSAVLGGFGPLVLTSLPSVLGHGLKNMDPDLLMNRKFKWPKIAWFNIAGKSYQPILYKSNF